MSKFDSLLAIGKSVRDAWFNPFTGFGTGHDKTHHTGFLGELRLPDVLLTNLFNSDDISRKVISLPPDEMFREGFTLVSKNPQARQRILERSEYLMLNDAFHDGILWARLYGGSVLFIGANDGQAADKQLDATRVKSVDFLDVFDRRRVWPWKWNQDPKHPRFGKPEVYSVQSLQGGIAYVHESRLVLFRGARTDDYTRRQLDGWDYSVLQNCLGSIEAFNETFTAARILMTEASIGIFTMKGLLSMIAGGQRESLVTRAQMLDLGKSVARSVFLDADSGEKFERVNVPFTGVGDQLLHAAKRLSAATDIPVIILMGETPSGLNASGDANVRLWYDRIKSQQMTTVVPPMLKVYRLIGHSLGFHDQELTLEPKPLWQMTPKEEADLRLAVAQTDKVYIDSEVLTPEEVAINRFPQGEGWSAETKIDPQHRLGEFAAPKTPGGMFGQ